MRLLFRLIILTILGFSQTINEQLKELENASPQRRVDLMNHIKEQLILMNQQERMQTIHKLRAKLQPQNQQFQQHEDIHHIENSQIIENNIHTDNIHQEVHSYQEHIKAVVVHREEQHIQNTHQEPINQPTITNTHQEPINQPTITNTHQEPINQPTITNTHQEPIKEPSVTDTHQEQSTIQFNNGRGK